MAMRRGALARLGLAGLLLWPAPAVAQNPAGGPLPPVAAPRGLWARDDPDGTARILTVEDRTAPRSAVRFLRSKLLLLTGYFDAQPLYSGVVSDDADQRIQAFFSATLRSQPVIGVLAVSTASSPPVFTMVLDRPAAFRESFARLAGDLPAFQLPGGGAGGGAAEPIPPLQPFTLPDGSGTIGLPAGWRITAGQKGSCDVAGPAGEFLSLGAAAPVWTTPAARMAGLLVAPYSDPVTALRNLSPQIAGIAARMGQPPSTLVRIIETTPTAAPSGQAALMLYETSYAGRPYLNLAWIMTSVTGAQNWLFYFSGVSAPSGQFARELPLLRAIWQSFSVSAGELQRRLDDAMQKMEQTWSMIRGAQANASRANQSAAEGWDQVVRGVLTIENPRSGFRAEVPNDKAQRWVDQLNGSGTGHWRIVPPSELIRP